MGLQKKFLMMQYIKGMVLFGIQEDISLKRF